MCLTLPLLFGDFPCASAQTDLVQSRDQDAQHGRYETAIALYKLGKPAESLEILSDLVSRFPREKAFLNDYVAVSSWSGNHDQALGKIGQLDMDSAPAYVLEAMANSQRAKHWLNQSLDTYAVAMRRYPDRIDPRIGHIQVLIELQDYQTAASELLDVQNRYPDRADIWDVNAQLQDNPKLAVNLLMLAQRILQTSLQNAFALRMRFHALKKLGAVHLAVEVTPEAVLTRGELLRAHRDRLAFDLRWARISSRQRSDPLRWEQLDAVINELRSMCGNAEFPTADSEVFQGACGDLVMALYDRGRASESIALYESMRNRNWAIPGYVSLYVAAAYMDDHQPGVARDLYAAALSGDPGNTDAGIGYAYALLDNKQISDAYQQIDQLAAATTETSDASDYVRIHVAGALIRSYSEKLGDAQQRLESLAARAPFNADIGIALASTYAMRGWNRRAEGELLKWQAVESGNVTVQRGLFESRMAINDFRGAVEPLASAVRIMPENREVKSAQREWTTHQLRELALDARFGRGKDASGAQGSHEHTIDTRLYTSPYREVWRFFGHAQVAAASYQDLNVERVSAGAGAEYRIRDSRLFGELFNVGNNGVGLALGADHEVTDHWSVSGRAELNTLAAPLRAYVDNTKADLMSLNGAYRWHESRNLNLSYRWMALSDGNHRQTAAMTWTERLTTGPTWNLDSAVDYESSGNSSQQAGINYFNPIRDQYLGGALMLAWRQSLGTDRHLRQVVSIGVGNYAQEGFSSGQVLNLTYEGNYQLNDRMEVYAAVGRILHPYDGAVDSSNFISGGLNWHF